MMNIVSNQYHQDTREQPMTYIAYNCTEKFINTSCVFEILVEMYDVPKKYVEDLKTIIDELKNKNLEHTKSITIFSESESVKRIWIKLERQDLVSDNLIDVYICYYPDDSVKKLTLLKKQTLLKKILIIGLFTCSIFILIFYLIHLIS